MARKKKIHTSTRAWRDAQKLAKKHPDTFEAPSLDTFDKMIAGDLVKFSTSGDRMWVIVTGFDGDKIVGLLSNNPVGTPGMKFGDIIEMRRKHVYAINVGNKTSIEKARKLALKGTRKAKVPKTAIKIFSRGRGDNKVSMYRGRGDKRFMIAGDRDLTSIMDLYAKARGKKAQRAAEFRLDAAMTEGQRENLRKEVEQMDY